MIIQGVLIVTLASLAAAGSIPTRRVVHESRGSVPPEWMPIRRAESDAFLPLRIGLVQPNIARLAEYLNDVSHPTSPNYGKHWTPADVTTAFRPTTASMKVVHNWLVGNEINSSRITRAKSGAWVSLNATVAEAERLLDTEYFVYQHSDGSTYLACKDAYHLPMHVSEHVDLVIPTLHFAMKAKQHARVDQSARPFASGKVEKVSAGLSHCDEVITLDCIRALYNFHYDPVASKKNSVGLVEFSPQILIPSDFDVYFNAYSKDQIGERPTLVSIDGGNFTTGNASDIFDLKESSLDVQNVMGLAGKDQKVLVYQVGDITGQESHSNFLDALDGSFCAFDDPDFDGTFPNDQPGGYTGPEDCGDKPRALVISNSYGYQEAELTPAYMRRQCAEFGKLALTGITFVYATGDTGVEGFDGSCLTDDGQMELGAPNFNTDYPASCPWVTAVSATQISPGNSPADPESAVFQRFFTGGGFSYVFPRQAWQQEAVSGYLNHHLPNLPKGVFNASGRGYPDLSANGLNYSIAIQGELTFVSGSSASAPTVAALLSAVNDARLGQGKGPIGWINPVLYSHPDMFNDITNGSNPGCGTSGFKASQGWDPVTGLGTPNFPKLLSTFLALP